MRQAGNPHREPWESCARCGFDFPVSMLRRQNGLLVCAGPGTTRCADIQGADHFRKRIRYPRREGVRILPNGNEVIE